MLGLFLERVLCVIDGFAEGERPDGAAVHTSHGFDEQLVGPGLKIHEKAPPAGRGSSRTLFDRRAAWHIHGDRLGEVDVLARRYGVGRLRRVEYGGVDSHRVQLLLEQPAVAGKAVEATSRRDVCFAPSSSARLGKVVGHRNDLVAAVPGE